MHLTHTVTLWTVPVHKLIELSRYQNFKLGEKKYLRPLIIPQQKEKKVIGTQNSMFSFLNSQPAHSTGTETDTGSQILIYITDIVSF